MYRSVSTSIWADDAILSMSPEQKLLFLYLHTNPYASACGIYKMQLRTMGFQLGLMHTPFESALKGLCAAFPDFVAADWQTGEVALLQYPRQVLIAATGRALAVVAKEVEGVESQYLLRELIARNSATINKPYLEQLRRLQMRAINEGKIAPIVKDYRVVVVEPDFYGDLPKATDNQEDDRKSKVKEIKEKKEKENAPACEEVFVPIVKPDFVQVAKEMAEYVKGEGRIQWDAMTDAQGFKGDAYPLFMKWAGKANDYQLRNWKDEIRRMGQWLYNEARANLKAQPRQEQALVIRKPLPQKQKQKRHIFTLDDAPDDVRERLQNHGL